MKHSVKFFLSCLLIGILINMACYAVPAYRPKIKVTVEGGEVYIQLCGDESCKYAITEDGYTILRDSIGWIYARQDDKGNVVPSKYRLVHRSKEDTELKNFLRSINKGLVPSVDKKNIYGCQRQQITPKGTLKSIRPVVGERRALIILMQFADKKFSKKREDFEALFNEVHYNADGAIGSVYDYYKEMSYGQLDLRSDIIGPYTSRHGMAYYGRNSSYGGGDNNPEALFEEALEYALSEVDFTRYDSDNDGYIDNIHIIFAGYGEEADASSDAIWSHQMTFYQPIQVQSLYVDRYSCSPELRGNKGNGITRIGAVCHEIGHALGAMDFYDTDYGKSGEYYGTGEWDIMAQGSWNDEGVNPADFNPYVKVVNFGWTNPSVVLDSEMSVDSIVKIGPNVICQINSKNGLDYFLVENTRRKGTFNSAHGEGMMIYHIGENIDEKSKTNSINATYPQECYPVCASAQSPYPSVGSAASFGNINSNGCPYPGSSGNTEFSNDSYPAAWDCRKDYIGISLMDISEDEEGNITFRPLCEGRGNEESLWSETFEDAKLSTWWKQTQIEGNGIWSVKKDLANLNGESAKKNNGYAILQSLGGATSLKREPIVVSLLSDVITVNADCDSLLLSFELKHEHKLQRDDYLTLYVKDTQDGILGSIPLTLTESIDWKEASLPFVNTNKMQLIFESNIDARSKLYLDNINISVLDKYSVGAEEPKMNRRTLFINGRAYLTSEKLNTDVKVYSSCGTLVNVLDINQDNGISLPVGLYIISDGDEYYKISVY